MKISVLAGDIGGTKTLLRLVRVDTADAGKPVPRLETLAEDSYPSQSYPDLAPIVRQFLDRTRAAADGAPPVARASFGIAGPIVNQKSELTNLRWSLCAERLGHDLSIPAVTLLNDFAAIGCGLAALEDDEVIPLQPGTVDPTAPIGVLGAGTGLGEGYLIPDERGRYQPFPSEGGHTDFPARNELEHDLLAHIRRSLGITQVSVERVVSGPGIACIYEFLRERDPGRETPALAQIHRTWLAEARKAERSVDLSAAVSAAALAGGDTLSVETMRLFVSAYGAEAGNLALKLLCKGGLYLAGGVAPKILPLIEDGTFIEAFLNKGRMRPVLENIPVRVVLNPKVGLVGAALHAANEALDAHAQ